ncbi:lysophospholipid acyltransferase family protein [Alcaligenaceae bacterium]|nr:lysophospholipid acyltransferase family protein [Alcaligenaceae bacterium]
MRLNKTTLLRAVFSYFGRATPASRKRWACSLGWLALHLMRSRAHIVRTNLALCFPDHSPQERETWARQHFNLLARSVIDRGLLWFGERELILNTIHTSGLEHLDRALAEKRRIILLAPHFVGLDAAATRLTMALQESATMYTPQSDAGIDQFVHVGRSRFNTVHLVSRRDGVRGLIRYLRQGVPVYYLPDMDFGIKGADFIPFFGVPAATLLATAQIAKAWDAIVLPIISRLDANTGTYQLDVLPPLQNFPGDDSPQLATARLNQLIESWVRVDPPQYYWVHRRFKTRPEGQPRVY